VRGCYVGIILLNLEITPKSDSRLKARMVVHYSQPKGFVGRSICYAILWDNTYYGHIVAGSSTLHLPGRNEFFEITKENLNNVVNNIFYSISPVLNRYPRRNFTTYVVQQWRERVKIDWKNKYGDSVFGYETLIELPRTGELYRRDGWQEVGMTKGYTCKRVAGTSTDSWSGKRVWNTENLRPKYVLCRKVD